MSIIKFKLVFSYSGEKGDYGIDGLVGEPGENAAIVNYY